MRLILTQPAVRFPDGRSHIRLIAPLVSRYNEKLTSDDILVLPELIGGEVDHDTYVSDVRWLAAAFGVWVVGGSHFRSEGHVKINSGVVVSPGGDVIAQYEKSNPYGAELAHAIAEGTGPATFEVNGVRCLAMICADFWYASTFEVRGPQPDVVIVPALSSSQRPTPHMARARWRHATVARAYEFAAFVGVSDWAHPVQNPDGVSSGVAGFAHPNPRDTQQLYRSLGRRRVQAFEIDLASQRDLRGNRDTRGFDLQRHLRPVIA